MAEHNEAPTAIVAFGDSITRGYAVPVGEGWVERLAAQGVPIHNAGGNGNTSAEGLLRIDADVLAHRPRLVLVEFGGNDAVHDARHVSVDAYTRHLATIRDRVQAQGGRIVLLTFPPVINAWHAWRRDPYYERWGGLDQCVEEYREQTRAFARQEGCPLFDLDRLLRERIAAEGAPSCILPDGVHLTPTGHQRVAEAVLELLTTNGFDHLKRSLP
jgi:lysophospholipase L1-like esterase